MSLQWRILGETDTEVFSLTTMAGESITVDPEGHFIIQEDNSTALDINFEMTDEGLVALKLKTGQYISVDDSFHLIAGDYSIDSYDRFLLERVDSDIIALKSIDGRYVSVLADGSLCFQESSYTNGLTLENMFNIAVADYETETTLLVTYSDEIFCTGLVIEEFSSSDLGLFYSANVNQTVAANLILSSIFLRNNTNNLLTVDSLLPPYGVVISPLS